MSPRKIAATATAAAIALTSLVTLGTVASASAMTAPTDRAATEVRDLVLHDPAQTDPKSYYGDFWVGGRADAPQTLFGAHSTATEYLFPVAGSTGQIVNESPYGDLCLTTGTVRGVTVVGERVCSDDPQQQWTVTPDGHLENATSGQQVGFVDVPDAGGEMPTSGSHRQLGMIASSNLVLADA